jgi:hypothetical protein
VPPFAGTRRRHPQAQLAPSESTPKEEQRSKDYAQVAEAVLDAWEHCMRHYGVWNGVERQ